MLIISKIVNFGVTPGDDIHTIQLKRQVNGLNLFYFFVALSAFLIINLFIPNSLILQTIQVAATMLYLSYLILNLFGKIKLTGALTIYTFEIQLFLVALFSNGFQSPVIYVFVLFPLLAGLVEQSLFKHLAISIFAVGILIVFHYFLPQIENAIMNISRFDSFRIEILAIMASTYIPVMAAVIILIILKENQRARMIQKEMLLTKTKYTENKKYLDHINEGLLLINRDFTIGSQYSKYILNIFSAEDLSNKNFVDVVYPDKENNREMRTALEQYLKILFNNDTANDSMLKDANPLKDRNLNFKEYIVKISFQRVINEDVIENVMALFEDETSVVLKERELEKEKTRKEKEMESITAILKQGPQTFGDFIDTTNNVLEEVVYNIDNLEGAGILERLFMDLHSLKGFARVLELNSMAEKLHGFENVFSVIRNKERPVDLELKRCIMDFINELSEEKKNIKRLLDKIASFNRFISNSDEPKSRALLENFIISLNDMVNSISIELGKDIDFKTSASVDEFPYLNKLRNAIIHLIRNSIDHGIEDKFERLSVNKSQKGTIIFKLHKDMENYFVEIIDDGAGLNFEVIKRKAFEKNKIADQNVAITKQEMINLIFSSDFSSKNTVTEISGRGIGLNVVKKDVERLNGKIMVYTEKGKGTKFILKIPADKTIQSDYAIPDYAL